MRIGVLARVTFVVSRPWWSSANYAVHEREVKRHVAIRRRDAQGCAPDHEVGGEPRRPATICEISFMIALVRTS
jgi:hypothetical protein